MSAPGASAAPSRDLLLVFAKAPRPGRVKTRLAAAVGDEAAARLYRVLGRRILGGVLGGPYEVEVHYDPPEALEEVRAWLGRERTYRPQGSGDLGRRMAEALASALGRAPRAAVVGTDAPDLDEARVEEAFRALDGADAVLGPTPDGGYYLVALAAPAHGLFRDVPWSTPRVLAVTLERARELGLRVALLPPLPDVDRLEDVPPDLLPVLREGTSHGEEEAAPAEGGGRGSLAGHGGGRSSSGPPGLPAPAPGVPGHHLAGRRGGPHP